MHDLGAVDPKTVPASPQPRDRHELRVVDKGGQQVGDVGGHRPWRAVRLELAACVAARQLELPASSAVLDAITERQAAAGEPMVGGVVVGRDEDPRDDRLTAEVWHREAFARRELHLTLECLPEVGHAHSLARTDGSVVSSRSQSFALTTADVTTSRLIRNRHTSSAAARPSAPYVPCFASAHGVMA